MRMCLREIASVVAAASVLANAAPALAQPYVDVQDILSPTGAVQIAVSPAYGILFVKNTSSAIAAVDIASGTFSVHRATYSFTDMSLSPDGRYLYAADYGGENIGYGTQLNPSSVHRFDLGARTWDVEGAVIAGDVQATGAESLVLKSIDQWVTFTDNVWSGGANLSQLNLNSNSAFPGFYASAYEGNFRYDVRSGRLIHGNSGLSSREIHAFTIVNGEFVAQETTGVYGSAQSYGTNVALATDGSIFYYGALAVDTLDVTHTLHTYPEPIYAANGDVAFGNGAYYDAHTAAKLGSLAFQSAVYAPNPSGCDFWVYDSAANMLRHFASSVDGGTTCGGGYDAGVGPEVDAGAPIAPTADASVSLDAASSSDAASSADVTDAASSADVTALGTGEEFDATASTDIDASERTGGDAESAFPSSDASSGAVRPMPDAAPVIIILERGGCSLAPRPSGGGTGAFAALSLALVSMLRRRRR